jgi:hypothetical protein
LRRLRQDASETNSTILVNYADSYEIRRKARSGWVCCASVLKETESVLAGCQHEALKSKKSSKKQRDKAALAAVTREMEWPRFAESARAEEIAAGHRSISRKRKLG